MPARLGPGSTRPTWLPISDKAPPKAKADDPCVSHSPWSLAALGDFPRRHQSRRERCWPIIGEQGPA